jgi:hypothetical protein
MRYAHVAIAPAPAPPVHVRTTRRRLQRTGVASAVGIGRHWWLRGRMVRPGQSLVWARMPPGGHGRAAQYLPSFSLQHRVLTSAIPLLGLVWHS